MTRAKAMAALEGPKPRPARSEEELDRMRAAHERRQRRRVPVTARVEKGAGGKTDLGAPHDDARGWLYRLGDAAGTASDEFAMAQLRHLVHMLPEQDSAPAINLNSMLAAVDGVRPENEAEGALAVQMAATHHLAMKCLSRASCASTVQQMEANGNLATKMLRTYAAQLEALAKLRRGGEQTVRVEHVHVYQGGQAIVGSVAARGGGVDGGNGQQPHAPLDARALAFAPVEPLLRDDAERVGVPVTGGQRQETMPDARRCEGKRGARG